MHLFLTKVAVRSCIYAQAFQTTVIYLSDLFTFDAKYFQFGNLSGEEWRSFANSLRGMLKRRCTVHEVAWLFNNLTCSSGLMFVWPGHFYNCF